jgi:tetratricopeptide (TPR) repeat protein
VRLADGELAVTARVGETPGELFTGAEASLDALTQSAAESVFAASQPYRYGVWLGENGRGQDGVSYYRRLIARQGPSPERSWDYNGLAQELYNLGDVPDAVAAAHAAIADDSSSPLGYLVLAEFQLAAGQIQAAHDTYARAAGRLKAGAGQITAVSRTDQILSAGALVREAEGDFTAALSANRRLSRLPDYNGQPHSALYFSVVDQARLHDVSGAWRAQALLPAERGGGVVLGGDDRDAANLTAMLIADAQGDGPRALALAGGLTPLMAGGPMPWSTTVAPVKALALARTGDLAGARTLIATTPADCYPCAIARARIATLAGDPLGADAAFAEAVRLAPSLPLADAVWARVLLNRGDIAAAISHAKRAAALGPRFADPLEYWGEALLRQGDARGAEAKFRAANALAPSWGANHMHWGEALMRQGRAAEARQQWLSARGMDLTPGERAWLDRPLAKGG